MNMKKLSFIFLVVSNLNQRALNHLLDIGVLLATIGLPISMTRANLLFRRLNMIAFIRIIMRQPQILCMFTGV